MTSYNSFEYFKVTSPSQYVAHVEINRPSKLNAFVEPMWLELRRVFEQLSTDPNVRAIVLSGAGDRAFTTGLDVQAAAGPDSILSTKAADGARKAQQLRRHVDEFQDCVSSVEKCEKPVICVLHGLALGLAIDLSSCADIRLCTADTAFAVKEVDIGLAADIGTLSRLPKIVGSTSWVKDVCLTARQFGAEEALRVGFVSGLFQGKVAAVKEGLRIAEVIASKSPIAVQGTKELLNHARDHRVADSLRYTSVWNAANLQTDDVKAALMGGLKKQKPVFAKL